MPRAKVDALVAALNNELYVTGGSTNPADLNNSVTSETYIYTPGEDAWRPGTAMPKALKYATACTLEGKMYVYGYEDDAPTFEVFDPGSGWSYLPLMNYPTRRGLRLAALNGIVYAIGGDNAGAPSPLIEAYSVTGQTWSNKTSMPTDLQNTGRMNSGVIVLGTNIYVIGGFRDTDEFANDKVLVYDTVEDSWSVLYPGFASINISLGISEGLIYGFGQYLANYNVTAIHMKYPDPYVGMTLDPEVGRLEIAPSENVGMGTNAPNIGGYLYFVGGAIGTTDNFTAVASLERYYPVP
jgi:hypothetical protein